jgi:hypothetical protein
MLLICEGLTFRVWLWMKKNQRQNNISNFNPKAIVISIHKVLLVFEGLLIYGSGNRKSKYGASLLDIDQDMNNYFNSLKLMRIVINLLINLE